MSEPSDIFLQFDFGGNERWEVITRDSGVREKVLLGEPGNKFKTELFKQCEKEVQRHSRKTFYFKVRKNYEDLKKEELDVEVGSMLLIFRLGKQTDAP
jgi:hypothetical protein